MKLQLGLAQVMLKLRTTKGFSLIEVMCGMTIIFYIIMFSFLCQVHSIILHKNNNEELKYIEYMSSLKNCILASCDFAYLNAQGGPQNKLYINKENISIDTLFAKNTKSLFDKNKFSEFPCVEISIEKDEIIKLNLVLQYRVKEETRYIKTIIYKGNYHE